MTPDEFRRHGREVIDWIADYMEQVEQLPVLSQVKPGEIRSRLPDRPPQQGEPFAAILRDLDEIIMPGITHWQSPNFFAYFPCNNSGPSILGELLASGLGVQGMLWSTSPACTELETHVLDWLVAALGLPERFLSTTAGGGVIQDSASSAALLRDPGRARAGDVRLESLTYWSPTPRPRPIPRSKRDSASPDWEATNFAASRPIEQWAMRPDRLAEAIAADVAAGRRPCFVCATAGTTSSLGFDPLREIGEICRRHDVWLHVDAALAGTAAICPEFRAMHDGLELADSYCFNPHKWMFTNFDCSCFFVADRGPLIRALGILPEYLKNQATQSGAVIDYRDWQVPLGRRFRALKLWFVLRWFGIEGIQQRMRQHVALAQELAGWVRGRSALRAGRAGRLEPRLLPPSRRRRGEPADSRPGERLRQVVPEPHAARRSLDVAVLRRADQHRAAARGGRHGNGLAKRRNSSRPQIIQHRPPERQGGKSTRPASRARPVEGTTRPSSKARSQSSWPSTRRVKSATFRRKITAAQGIGRGPAAGRRSRSDTSARQRAIQVPAAGRVGPPPPAARTCRTSSAAAPADRAAAPCRTRRAEPVQDLADPGTSGPDLFLK